jgi:hypothetical protein
MYMTRAPVTRQRNWAVYVLAGLAVLAALAALFDAARYMGWLPIATFGEIKFFMPNVQWFAAIMAVVLAFIWFMVAGWIWNLNPSGWLFMVVMAVINLIFLFLAVLGQTTFTSVMVQIVINALVLILAFLPGTQRAFGRAA